MPWYEELFAAGDPARLGQYGETEASRNQVSFVIEKLELKPGMRVLDLCCGQGRHLVDLARRGFDMVGVDLSEYMLGKCREAAAREGIEARLIRADMREIKFDEEFDGILNMATSFGYLESDQEDQKALDAVGPALKPGGRFFIDLMNRDSLMRRFQGRHWDENERGEVTISEREFDPLTGRINCVETTIYPDGRRVERPHSVRLYACSELARMLNAAGLEVESILGGYDGSELTMDAKRMIVIARK